MSAKVKSTDSKTSGDDSMCRMTKRLRTNNGAMIEVTFMATATETDAATAVTTAAQATTSPKEPDEKGSLIWVVTHLIDHGEIAEQRSFRRECDAALEYIVMCAASCFHGTAEARPKGETPWDKMLTENNGTDQSKWSKLARELYDTPKRRDDWKSNCPKTVERILREILLKSFGSLTIEEAQNCVDCHFDGDEVVILGNDLK